MAQFSNARLRCVCAPGAQKSAQRVPYFFSIGIKSEMTSKDAGSTSGSIKIGVLYSRSGVTSAAETTQLQATILAVEEINRAGGVLGREIELVCFDPQCQPRNYADLAEQLILKHRVRLIVGCYMSSTRKAVIPIVERHNCCCSMQRRTKASTNWLRVFSELEFAYKPQQVRVFADTSEAARIPLHWCSRWREASPDKGFQRN